MLVDAPASVASLIVPCHSPDLQHATRHFNSIARQGTAVGPDPLNPVKKGKKIIRFCSMSLVSGLDEPPISAEISNHLTSEQSVSSQGCLKCLVVDNTPSIVKGPPVRVDRVFRTWRRWSVGIEATTALRSVSVLVTSAIFVCLIVHSRGVTGSDK